MRRMMRCSCVLLMLSLMLFVGGSVVCAAEVIGSGDCGEHVSWVLTDDGRLTISGEGSMTDYTYNDPAPWKDHVEAITHIVVEEGVTGVGSHAFSNCVNVQEVSLPHSLLRMGHHAFNGCSALQEIVIPDQLEILNDLVFFSCKALQSVSIGKSVKYISINAFGRCESLKEIRIPQSVRQIGGSAFYSCTGLESVELEEGVQFIDRYAFHGCTALKEIIFPESLRHIDEGVFANCQALETVKMNDGLIEIGKDAFSECDSLQTVVIPPSVKRVCEYAFFSCDSLETVILSEGLEYIHDDTFNQCRHLQSVVIPASVVSLGNDVFNKTDSLQTIHLLGDASDIVEDFLSGCPNHVEICVNQDGAGWDSPEWADYDLIPCSYTCTSTASCTEDGTGYLTCSHCELNYSYPISAGHRYGEWYTILEPSETEEGQWERACENCGQEEIWVIPAVEQAPLHSDNESDQNYIVWSQTVKSYLRDNGDGTLTRLEAGDTGVSVELYDENRNFVSRRVLPMELPIFGGFYEGADYFYLVFGQKNLNEDDNREVIRVVCYSKDWVRLGYASMLGYDIIAPFDMGSLRMAQAGDTLYVLTCRRCYMSTDGLNHQSNLLLRIPIRKVSSGGQHILPYSDYENWFVSHSFNQFLLVKEDQVLFLNQGDGFPRSAVIHEMQKYITTEMGHPVMVFADSGEFHYNYTGASLGGFVLSDSAYLTAGNSIRQDGTVKMDGQRNIFLGVTTENDAGEKSTTIKWITNHSDDLGWKVSTPHLVKIGGDEFLLLWNEGRDMERILRYVFVDGTGEMTSPIYEQDWMYMLSDCVPIVFGDRVCWYTTLDSAPVFYEVPLGEPESVEIHGPEVTVTLCSENSGTEEQTTITRRYGSPIGELPVPVRKPAYVFLGWYTSQDVLFTADTRIEQITGVSLYAKWELTEHDHEYEVVSEKPADCAGPHTVLYECKYCDDGYTETEGLSGHTWDEGTVITEPTCNQRGEMLYICTLCQTTKTERIPSLDHDWQEVVTKPTCTESGYTTRYCTICDDRFVIGTIYPLGHKYEAGACIRCGEADPEFEKPVVNPFLDVKETDYFFKPVLWAVENGITAGTGADTFSPNATCTRAQVVTFLWRAMGKPAPENTENPFTDVHSGDYFCDAVLWAVENGITSGTGNGQFSPNRPCTRDQVVTFLWRTLGKPAPQKMDNPFSDVAPGMYYYEPVLWAVENGITSGTSATTFAPSNPCTRGQVVTFLYRALKDK